MSLLNPSALYLLALIGPIVLLHLLRAQERKREVSALFLWEGLRGDSPSRAARIRRRIDPLLMLQLLALCALVAALARPAWESTTIRASSLAIVLDGSASMRTRTEDGGTRYQRATEEALALLDAIPSTSTAVVQWSSTPEILGRPGMPLSDVKGAIRRSEPTWYADGGYESLAAALGSLGGFSEFDRIVLLSDHGYAELQGLVEWVPTGGGENRGLTAFSVRENGSRPGAAAFIEVTNDTDAYQEARIRVSDGASQTTLSVLLSPNRTEHYVVPFPSSRGTWFTASLEPEDSFPGDDTRFFALDRRLDLRVRWMGERNRYLLAALESASPISWVGEGEPADLTVAYDVSVPRTVTGDVLLIHGGVDGLVALGEERSGDRISVADPASVLLTGVESANLRVRTIPDVELGATVHRILDSGNAPFLFEVEDGDRRILVLAADLMMTNLPITVDFPLLIRNYVGKIARPAARLTYSSASVGDPVSVTGRGAIAGLLDPDGRAVAISPGMATFRPSRPGRYTLHTDRGTYAIAANVAPSESIDDRTLAVVGSSVAASCETSSMRTPLWPYAALGGIAILFAEGHKAVGGRRPSRRPR